MYYRTSQGLELFEEAPDDGANWGNAVSTLKILTKFEDSDSSDDDGVQCTAAPVKSEKSRQRTTKRITSNGAHSNNIHETTEENGVDNNKRSNKQQISRNKV